MSPVPSEWLPVYRVRIHCKDAPEFLAQHASGIAQRGVFVTPPKLLALGTHVKVKLEFSGGVVGVSGEAVVARHAPSSRGTGMALHLVRLNADSAQFPLTPLPAPLAGASVARATEDHVLLGVEEPSSPPSPSPVPARPASTTSSRWGSTPAPPQAPRPSPEPAARPLAPLSRPPPAPPPPPPAAPVLASFAAPVAAPAVAPGLLAPPAPAVAAPAPAPAPLPVPVPALESAPPAPPEEVPAPEPAIERLAPPPRVEVGGDRARRHARERKVLLIAVPVALVLGAVVAGWVSSVRERGAAVDRHLALAEERLAAGRLAGPSGDEALDHLLAARALRGEDARVRERLKALADIFEDLGERALARGDIAEAAVHLQGVVLADPSREVAARRLQDLERRMRSAEAH